MRGGCGSVVERQFVVLNVAGSIPVSHPKNSMTEITYTTSKENGIIHWAASEKFKELENKRFNLGEMEAAQIEKLENLSITAKILLSAVAGAIIQHLIDKGIKIEEISHTGSFIVKK